MPAYSTHYIFATEMMPFLRTLDDMKLCEEAVLVGTQGPDIFFFHRVFSLEKSLRALGSELHRTKPSVILEFMRQYCDNMSDNKDIARSYVCGFILHYALDRRCHPFVYSLQDKLVKQGHFVNPHTAHNLIEFGMDAYLLNKRLKVDNPVTFDTAQTVTQNKIVIDEIASLYEYIIPEITAHTVTKGDITLALRDTRTVQRATHDAHGIKRAIVTVIESIAAPFSKNYKFSAMFRPRHLEKAKKYANISNRKWQSAFDKSIHTESFEDLFNLARQEAEQMLCSFLNGDDTEQITNNISFLTGVEIK